MTAIARITRALRILDVQAAGETTEAAIAADSLQILNDMLSEWEAAGFGFTAPAYATLATVETLPEADWEAVSANLAVRLAPEFAIAPSELLIAASAGLLRGLVARYNKPTY